jgi:hypothetical protein
VRPTLRESPSIVEGIFSPVIKPWTAVNCSQPQSTGDWGLRSTAVHVSHCSRSWSEVQTGPRYAVQSSRKPELDQTDRGERWCQQCPDITGSHLPGYIMSQIANNYWVITCSGSGHAPPARPSARKSGSHAFKSLSKIHPSPFPVYFLFRTGGLEGPTLRVGVRLETRDR